MSFADLKGQEVAVSFLKAALKNNKLSHAYIFCGPGGVGKLSAAINFAKALTCPNSVSYEPCDVCPSCKKIDNRVHPDVFVLKPQAEGSSIKIDDIRHLIKDIYLKPFEAKKKVYIIDNAQDMKHEAANALLKTLEEPPTNSILILITDNLKALFHTVVSRAQIVRFYPLKLGEIRDKYAADEYRANILSRLTQGQISEGLAGISFDDVQKEKAVVYLDILLSWFRDILSAKAGADSSMLINIDKIDLITTQAKQLSFEYLEDVINNIILTLSYLDQNANTKLAMSTLAFKICEV